MKNFALIAIALFTLIWFTAAQERNGLVVQDTQVAIDFLYENGLTMFDNETNFMANQSLRRDEAAAFFARFSRDVLGNVPDTSKTECNSFTDVSLGHSTLQAEMIASCQLWLFKGSQGRFMPTASFTNAEALTVLVRLIDWFKDETWSHWAEQYRITASNMWLTNWLAANQRANLDSAITRWNVAKLIEAGNKRQQENGNKNQNQKESELPPCLIIEQPTPWQTVSFPLEIEWYIDLQGWIDGTCKMRAYHAGAAWPIQVIDQNGNNLIDTPIFLMLPLDYNYSTEIEELEVHGIISWLSEQPYTNNINLKFQSLPLKDGEEIQTITIPLTTTLWNNNNSQTEETKTNSQTNSAGSQSWWQEINITYYLTSHPIDLDLNNIEDYMVEVFYPIQVNNTQTETLIYSALNRLFDISTFEYWQSWYGNYLYESNLEVVEVINNPQSITINLSWTLIGIGVMADPMIKRQIERTIEHYTVQPYTIILNWSSNRSCILNPSC